MIRLLKQSPAGLLKDPKSNRIETSVMFNRIITFLKESRVELKKVRWPTREETIRYTMSVILISAALAIFLGGLDYIFQFILNTFLLR